MAKMVTCKTCSKEVATSAKVCPGCGAKLKAGFFKKAILGIVGFIIVIAIIANMGKDKPTTEASTKAGTETKKDAAPVQQELSKEGVSSDVKIVVDGFESKAEVGDNQFSKVKAQGAFKIVKVTLTNNQKDAITIDGNSFKLIDDQKREFTYSTEALIAMESSVKDKKDSFFLKKLNPGLSATGYVVFDVPADAKGFVLEASGGFTGKKIKLKVE